MDDISLFEFSIGYVRAPPVVPVGVGPEIPSFPNVHGNLNGSARPDFGGDFGHCNGVGVFVTGHALHRYCTYVRRIEPTDPRPVPFSTHCCSLALLLGMRIQ